MLVCIATTSARTRITWKASWYLESQVPGKLCPWSLLLPTHVLINHFFHAHYSPQLVERWTYVSSLLLSHTPHRSRTGTTGWGAWRMLRCVRERSRSSSPSQLWFAGPLSPYNVIIYFVQNSYYIVKMWHLILCHDSSYVWDLVPAHLVIMFAPGSWCPEIRVWQTRRAGYEKGA
jgi:hypothetical protein